VGIADRLAGNRALVVWLVALLPVPLAFLGCLVLEIAQWQNAEPQPAWRPFVEWYLVFGASPSVSGAVGWLATRSPRRTLVLATASLVAFFVWGVVFLEIHEWVTGVPIVPNPD
jgi:hypothetical protein